MTCYQVVWKESGCLTQGLGYPKSIDDVDDSTLHLNLRLVLALIACNCCGVVVAVADFRTKGLEFETLKAALVFVEKSIGNLKGCIALPKSLV